MLEEAGWSGSPSIESYLKAQNFDQSLIDSTRAEAAALAEAESVIGRS